jgi:crotonobetaine/carnitine-CoA ligase
METYERFIGAAAKFANALCDIGIKTQDTVVIFCPSGLPHLHAWMGCALLGATEVPVNTLLRGEPLQHILQMAQPTVAVVSGELVPRLLEANAAVGCLRSVIVVGHLDHAANTIEPGISVINYEQVLAAGSNKIPGAQVTPATIGSVMFTSGTTGPAKGVMMPNGQLCMTALQVMDAVRMRDTDIFYCAHPLNHIAGKYIGVLATFLAGGQIVLDDRFEATSWLGRIRDCGATISIAHGPMIEMIARLPPTPSDRDHRMRRLMCCPMPKHLAAGFQQRFDLQSIEMWGMTEIGCPSWTSLDRPYVPGSCGRPLRNYYDLRIVNPDTDEEMLPNFTGEIVVRPLYPSTIMQGYLGMYQETVHSWRNLWFHTGDAGYLDEDGNMFFVDRLKERIRRRAENISAYDIENAALSFPQIREAAAVGVPSEFEGDDDIKLCIVCEGVIDPVDLLTFLAARLPPFMLPRYIERSDALPRTPTNKVKKRELSAAGVGATTWDRNRQSVRLRDLYNRNR